jgi:DNA replication protein DnaC
MRPAGPPGSGRPGSLPTPSPSPRGSPNCLPSRSKSIVIDDIGVLPVESIQAEAFHRILDTAYERRSIILTSNTHPSGFDSIMPKTLATAGVDRLMHHAHLILAIGDSFRFTEAKKGGGVTPLVS